MRRGAVLPPLSSLGYLAFRIDAGGEGGIRTPDHCPGDQTGMVCFITMSGFLGGEAFQRMRDYLRRTCDRIWVIDCSPNGHQPDVNTRIFGGVQQPVCIVLASRSAAKVSPTPADVFWTSLPKGHRESKFAALNKLTLASPEWAKCPEDWRSPFLPASSDTWASFPALKDYFYYGA